ncbi:MAG: hypothetical protein LBU40_06295, partial [Methanobrevibacter sp.]|nr:hypothetical protein [Methanobrevibacter sp.]
LYSQIDKITSTVSKAQNALLDVADELTDLILQANAIGGKVAQLVPSHLKPHIAAITKMADKDLQEINDGQGPSSLSNLKTLLGNIPYRDIRPQDTTDVRSQISMQPNLTAGPQSQISESSLEEFYKNTLKEQAENYQYNDTILSFDKLKESEIFGMKYEEDMLEKTKMRMSEPIDTKTLREKIRTRVDQDIFEDTGEELQENQRLDFNNIRAFGGSDGMPMSFGALREGINMVDAT